MTETLTDQLINTPERRRLYQQEYAIQQATDLICELMNNDEVSRSELARRLGTTKGYVTQMLDGRTNMTVRTLADVMTALQYTIRFEADPPQISPEYTLALDAHSCKSVQWLQPPRFTGVPSLPERLVA